MFFFFKQKTAYEISMGNGEIGTASGATSYFENMVIDYAQGVFPLGPGGTPPSTAAPTLTSVAPTSGSTAGGTQLTLTGTNFASGATVSVGGIAATAVTVVSATTFRATRPAHAAGAVNVVVPNPDRQSATLANGFLYVGRSEERR